MPAQVFNQNIWEQKLLILVINSHLPCLFLEHQEFHDLILYARLAPTTPSILSRKVIRTRLHQFVTEKHTTTLQSLPPDAKLSLALDCWTSPFQQAFMAITAYFFDGSIAKSFLESSHFLVHIQAPTLVRLLYGFSDNVKSLTEYSRLQRIMHQIIQHLWLQ